VITECHLVGAVGHHVQPDGLRQSRGRVEVIDTTTEHVDTLKHTGSIGSN